MASGVLQFEAGLQHCGLVWCHGLTDANLRLGIDAQRPQAQRDVSSRSFNIRSRGCHRQNAGEVCVLYLVICLLYQETHRICTRALRKAQRNLLIKKMLVIERGR